MARRQSKRSGLGCIPNGSLFLLALVFVEEIERFRKNLRPGFGVRTAWNANERGIDAGFPGQFDHLLGSVIGHGGIGIAMYGENRNVLQLRVGEFLGSERARTR